MLEKIRHYWQFWVGTIFFFIIFYKIFLYRLYPIPSDLLVAWFAPYNGGGWEGYTPWVTHKEFIAADVLRQLFPWRSLAVDMFRHFRFPLWNPYAFSGTPLLANLQSSVFYPVNIIFFFFTDKVAWISYILLQPILGCFFTYLFVRSLRLSSLASLYAGLAFGSIGYLQIWFEWGVVGHSAIWLPLSLYGITSAFNKKNPRYLLISIVALTWSVFAGHIQTAFYVYFVTFLYSIFFALYELDSKKNFLKRVVKIVWIFPFAVLLSSVQLLPSIELLSNSLRESGSTIIFHKFLLPIPQLLTLFAPDFFGNPAVNNYWGKDYGEFMVYAGILTLVLACFGIAGFLKNRFVLFFSFVGVLGILFALPTPIAESFFSFHIPVLSSSIPSRALFLFQFALVVLSAFGIESLVKNRIKKPVFFIILAVYALLWLFVLLSPKFLANPTLQQNLQTAKRNLVFPTLLVCIILLLVFIRTRAHRFTYGICLIIFFLLAIEWQYFMYKYSPFARFEAFFPNHVLITQLQKQAGFDRVYGYDRTRLETNLPTQWHLLSAEGYDPLYIKRYGELIAASINGAYTNSVPRSDANFSYSAAQDDGYPKQVLFNLLDVRYIIDRDDFENPVSKSKPGKYPEDRFQFVWQDHKWKLFQNIQAIPHAAVFYNYQLEKNNEKILSTLFDKSFPYTSTLLLEEQLNGFTSQNDRPFTPATITEYTPNKVIIQTQTKNQGLLFLSDSDYLGWQASLDGTKTKIYRADYAFRSVVVPPGRHTVVFEYQPLIFYLGLSLSGIGTIVFVVFWRWKKILHQIVV